MRAVERENAPPGPRRGVVGSDGVGLLPLERPDVVHDLPALVLWKVLPRGHCAPSVRDLPEDLSISLLLDDVARPVRGLRRWQRGRGRPIALSRGTVARHAVRLDRLLRVTD